MTAVDGAPVGRLFTTWITSLDGVDHAVTDEECAARLAAARGWFLAVCGAEFLPGPMEDAPAPPCRRCVAFLRAHAEMRGVSERLATRRRGWLSRLLCRRELPASADGDCLPPDASASAGDHTVSGAEPVR